VGAAEMPTRPIILGDNVRINSIIKAEEVKPGMKLYLGNRYDIVENQLLRLNLDRTGKNQQLEYTVPKNVTEEQIAKIKELLINRTLSFKSMDDTRFERTKIVEEAKSFSYKAVKNMTMTELKYLASKLGIEVDRGDKREYIRARIENALDKTGKQKKSK
jgi:hypothetical protein